jgi:hypothetical protein
MLFLYYTVTFSQDWRTTYRMQYSNQYLVRKLLILNNTFRPYTVPESLVPPERCFQLRTWFSSMSNRKYTANFFRQKHSVGIMRI